MSNYNYDVNDLTEMLAVIFSSATLLTIFIVVLSIIALFFVAKYVLTCIGLFRMAKKLEYDNSWLAWIPFANIWLMFHLPRNEYRVLAFNKPIQNRTNAFWIHMAIQYGTETAISILAAIPVIGYLTILISPLSGIFVAVAYIFMMFPVYEDLYKIFLPEKTAHTYAIVSIIFHFVLPVVTAVLMLVASGKDPVEVEEETLYN